MGFLGNDELEHLLDQVYGVTVIDLSWYDSLYLKRVAAKLECADGWRKLKRYAGTEEALLRLYKKHQALVGAHLSGLPKWYATRAGKPYLKYGGELYYLIDWINGRTFQHSESDARSLGHTLATIHKTRPDLKAFRHPYWRARLRPSMNASRLLDKGISRRLPANARHFVEREGDDIQKTLQRSFHRLHSLHKHLRSGVVHGDVTVPNVLFVGKQAHLIDWERVDLGFPIEELAKTAMNTCHFSVSLVEQLLSGYGYHRFHRHEQALFSAFLEIPREVVHLLQRAANSGTKGKDEAQWDFIIATWEKRRELHRHFSVR